MTPSQSAILSRSAFGRALLCMGIAATATGPAAAQAPSAGRAAPAPSPTPPPPPGPPSPTALPPATAAATPALGPPASPGAGTPPEPANAMPAGAATAPAPMPTSPPPGAPLEYPRPAGTPGNGYPGGQMMAPVYYGPPPPVPMGIREHDGFYLRLALGGSRFGASFASDSSREVNGSIDGTLGQGAIAFEVAVGGTPAPGLVIGGGFYTDLALGQPAATDARINGKRAGTVTFDRASLGLIGPFVDYYIDPKLGWHLQGALGIAGMGFGKATRSGQPAPSEKATGGLGFMLGGGYDWWIAEQWSLGALLRFVYVSTESNNEEADRWRARGFAFPELMFDATYH